MKVRKALKILATAQSYDVVDVVTGEVYASNYGEYTAPKRSRKVLRMKVLFISSDEVITIWVNPKK
jgi:hypothetical protein